MGYSIKFYDGKGSEINCDEMNRILDIAIEFISIQNHKHPFCIMIDGAKIYDFIYREGWSVSNEVNKINELREKKDG